MTTEPVIDVAPRYEVIALSIQADGEQWMVGSTERGEFYQLPSEGVYVLHLLQRGQPVAAIAKSCQQKFLERIDVDAFIEQLLEIGFIHPAGEQPAPAAEPTPAQDAKRLRFSMSQRTALRFFSPPAIALYLAIVGGATLMMISDPSLRPNLVALYFEDRLSLTLVLLLVLYSCTALLHEFGHLIAAARRGVASKLGLGNRLWMIVAEADLTNIFSLPKTQRYLPLLAGMAVDVISISVITLTIAVLQYLAVDAYVIHLLQALILQVLISISWQFNFFLKTDVYYVLCNYFGYPDLDRDARHYLRSLLHRCSGGLIGATPEPYQYYRLDVVKYFSLVWIVGRVLAIAFLAAVLIPTIARYAAAFYGAITDSSTPTHNAWDLGLFVLISSALLGTGMYLWLFKRLATRFRARLFPSEPSQDRQ